MGRLFRYKKVVYPYLLTYERTGSENVQNVPQGNMV